MKNIMIYEDRRGNVMASPLEATTGDFYSNNGPDSNRPALSVVPGLKNETVAISPVLTRPEAFGEPLPAEGAMITTIKVKMAGLNPENQEADTRKLLWEIMLECGLVSEDDAPRFAALNDLAVGQDDVSKAERRSFNSELIEVGEGLEESGHILVNLIQKAIDSYEGDAASMSKITPLMRRVLLIARVEQQLGA